MSSSKQINPPKASVMIGALANIVQRRDKTQENLAAAKKQLADMNKKNASSTVRDPVARKIQRLEAEVAGWPSTYETELKRWLLSQPSVANGTAGTTLPQEIKNEISKYLQTTRIKQIEQEVMKKQK
ncbi:hypothetical protein B0J18DRAFT_452947 [Chaetomium sp. MPI-SDFR-AT-0129]|nr:hypothetical protein B0J18DRAFT_452947 [Chaetomium sp. MPI-SDFR-AT-0129]